MTEVKWHPPATSIRDGAATSGHIKATGWGGLGGGSLIPETISWGGREWRVAYSKAQGVLWVVADTDEEVRDPANASTLASMARAFAKGQIDRTGTQLHQQPGQRAGWTAPATVSQGLASDARRSSDKMSRPATLERSLAAVTGAVAQAIALGASPRDIRLAVYSAMGLDEADAS